MCPVFLLPNAFHMPLLYHGSTWLTQSEKVCCSVRRVTEAMGNSTKYHPNALGFQSESLPPGCACTRLTSQLVLRWTFFWDGELKVCGSQPLRWCPVIPSSWFSCSCIVSSLIVAGLVCMTNRMQQKGRYMSLRLAEQRHYTSALVSALDCSLWRKLTAML